MGRIRRHVTPEEVLRRIVGRTSLELGISEKRRDELIAAAIFTSFRNQEYATNFKLPVNYCEADVTDDARGIDVVVESSNGRRKKLQIKGVYIQRSIERRRHHKTRGMAKILGRRSQRYVRRDSQELTEIMEGELRKIIQDYSGITLIIHVIADFATQTSLEIAIRNNRRLLENLKAKEIWFLRHIPVRVVHGKKENTRCYAYKLIQVIPDRHTYAFSFDLGPVPAS